LPLAAKGCCSGDAAGGSAARTSARTGTATAAAAKRGGGGDGKTGPVPSLNEIDLHGAASLQQAFFHKKGQAAFLKHFIAIFWLIQSQSKGWATSAALHQSDANGRTDFVLLQVGFQIIYSKGCDFKHLCLLKSEKYSFRRAGKSVALWCKIKAQRGSRQP